MLFDASSGDYWVLAADARSVIEWLQAERAVDRRALLERLALGTADGETLLGSLGAAGLLVTMLDGVAVRLPSPTDD